MPALLLERPLCVGDKRPALTGDQDQCVGHLEAEAPSKIEGGGYAPLIERAVVLG